MQYMSDPDSEDLILGLSHPTEAIPNGTRINIHEGITGHIIRSRSLSIVEDVQKDPRVKIPETAAQLMFDMRTVISTPLFVDSELVGVMHIGWKRILNDTESQCSLIEALANVIGSSLHRVRLLETLEERVEVRNRELAIKNAELQSANQRLVKLDELKSKFVSDVSHELRTPVTSLGLYLDLMQRRPDKQDFYIETIRGEVKKLRSLVLDVLKLSRFDLGRVQVAFASLQLNELVAGEIDLYQAKAQANELQLLFAPSHDLPHMIGEPTQLSEMITALLDNALSYTKEGSVSVTTYFDEETDRIVMEIRDTGMGIIEEEVGEVFGRFYRGSNSHSIPGSGLGLTLVNEIVNLHGGEITLESQPEVGTTVTVYLSRTRDEA